jgi:Flp pilus assembly pilin Flp
MPGFLQHFLAGRPSSTAIEYGPRAALIAVVLAAALGSIGIELSSTFTTVSGSVP